MALCALHNSTPTATLSPTPLDCATTTLLRYRPLRSSRASARREAADIVAENRPDSSALNRAVIEAFLTRERAVLDAAEW